MAKIYEMNIKHPCEDTIVEKLALYFEELAAEIRVFTVNAEDLDIVFSEVNRALSTAYNILEQKEERKNA